MNFAVGCTAFFTESSLKLMDAWLVFYFVLSGYLVPVDLFPPALRAAVDWLPFRYQIGFPVELMTGALGTRASARPARAAMGVGRDRPRRRRPSCGDAGCGGSRRTEADAVRYLRLLGDPAPHLARARRMQYRADFLLDAFIEVFWMATAIVPLARRVPRAPDVIAGWTFGEALMVMGWFTFLQGVLEGAINPSLVTVVDHIRKGTLDFVLLKPADAQFLVSTARFLPWRSVNVVTALGIFAWGFRLLGPRPDARSTWRSPR